MDLEDLGKIREILKSMWEIPRKKYTMKKCGKRLVCGR
jgi:hypothetical protein